MKMHPSVTKDRICDAAEQSLFGDGGMAICIACGKDVEGLEPDVRKAKCPACDEHAVYGAEELLFIVQD